MRYCVYCKTRYEKGSGVTFHKFPSDYTLKLWLKKMKLDNWTPKTWDSLCSKHFTDDCFIKHESRTTLKKCSIPTIFHGISSKETKSISDASLPASETSLPLSDTRVPRLNTQLPSSDTTDTQLTPLDTTLTPSDSHITPSDTTLTPSNTTLTQSDSRVTPLVTSITPSDSLITPSDSHLTPSVTRVTPLVNRVTQSVTRVTPSVTRVTPLVTRVTQSVTRVTPSVTRVPQIVTCVTPSVTRVTPLVTRVTPSDTRVTPSDTCLPPSTTEDGVDNDDSQDLDSSKHNNTEKPALKSKTWITNFTVWSDTLQTEYRYVTSKKKHEDHTYSTVVLPKQTPIQTGKPPKPYELNKPNKKPVLVVVRPKSKLFKIRNKKIRSSSTPKIGVKSTAIHSASTDPSPADKSAVTLSASTDPSPELPVEIADKKLDGFKLGVSEKVLQFRLVDNGDCDEPIYKVLSEEEPETKEDKTTGSTEDDTVLQEEPSTTEDDDVENKSESRENVSEYENHKDIECWKLKLTQILHEAKFCGICLNVEDGMNAISDELEIVTCEVTYRNTLRHIVDSVFKEIDYPLANSQVCKGCTEKLIQSYIFIRSAEETAKVLNHHLDELYYKTCYIRNNDLKHKQAGSEIYNVVIALDKVIPKSFDCDVKIEEPETAESELIRPRAKRKLKCVSCNVILPSYRAWRVHETRTHKSNHRCRICLQSFKTRQDFTAHYRMHLNSRCTICHRRVQDGRLLQHLKRRHGRSIHLCSTCDVAFYSATALDRHDRECHYSADSRCVTCLRSLSRDELELHRCRFACPECGEAPCVHHEYLMSYREQVLNLADRAACQHCSYVCASKEALVAHANARHLKVQPLRCGRCALTFHSRSDLRSHVCTSKQTSKYVHACQYCDEQFSEEVMCGRHSKECGRVQRQHQCEYCPANFDSSKNLIEHRKCKHGKHMFTCDLCDKVFLNDLKKQKHLLQVHSRHKDCVLCRKKFPTKATLLLHLRYHEPGTKFPCGVCRAQFDTVAQFSAHNCKRTRLWAICDTCGAIVKQVLLRKHMRAHSGAAVTCDTCGKSFQNVTTLQYHLKRHQRNVSCRICKKLMNSAKLWRHFRNHLIRESYQEKLMKNLF